MTPKEKAQDIFVKYYERLPDSIYSNYAAKMEAKHFSLIAVDEIIESYKGIYDDSIMLYERYSGIPSYEGMRYYWDEVKKEIEII